MHCPECGSQDIKEIEEIAFYWDAFPEKWICEKCGFKWITKEELETMIMDSAIELAKRVAGNFCPKCNSEKIIENPLKFDIIPEKWLCEDCGFSWSLPEDVKEVLLEVGKEFKTNEV